MPWMAYNFTPFSNSTSQFSPSRVIATISMSSSDQILTAGAMSTSSNISGSNTRNLSFDSANEFAICKPSFWFLFGNLFPFSYPNYTRLTRGLHSSHSMISQMRFLELTLPARLTGIRCGIPKIPAINSVTISSPVFL